MSLANESYLTPGRPATIPRATREGRVRPFRIPNAEGATARALATSAGGYYHRPHSGRRDELRLLRRPEGPARPGAEVPEPARGAGAGAQDSRDRCAVRRRALARHGGAGVAGHRNSRMLRRRRVRVSRALGYRGRAWTEAR